MASQFISLPLSSGNATSIQGIHVAPTTPTNGQVLIYNSMNNDYEPGSLSGTGDVVGPASATSTALVRFNGTTGKSIQNSAVLLDGSANLTGVNSITISNNGLLLMDTNASNTLLVMPGSDLSADRTFTLTTGDADRTLTMTGNATISGTNTGDVTIGTFGSSPTANGISISGQVITLQPADATHPGALTTASQTMAGAKTFSTAPILSSLTASLPLQLDASKNIVSTAIDLSGTQATGTLAGARFPALTGDITTSAGSLATTLATVNANVGTFASHTVNAKGLTTAAANLSGDITTSGSVSTLATVNANVGSFGSSTAIPNFTVNGKGLITAAGTNAVVAPAGTLTGTTLASNVVTSSLTSVGTIATGVWNGTTIAVANGGTGVTTSTGTTNVVLSGSPTIATPTITTSAIIPIVIGGTGTTSTLSLRPTSGAGTTGADIIFQSGTNGGTETMRILNSGSVGIGTISPGAKLEINAPRDTTFLRLSANNVNNLNQTIALDFFDSIASNQQAKIQTITDSSAGADLQFFTKNNNGSVGSATEKMRLTSEGSLGIGTTGPSAQLHTTGTVRFANFGAGTATFDASGNISSVSDERFKDIQGDFKASLNEIKAIIPILYKWNEKSGLETDGVYAGFSAQNVGKAIPEAVGVKALPDIDVDAAAAKAAKTPIPNKDYYSLQDRALLAAVINAIKELDQRISALEGNA